MNDGKHGLRACALGAVLLGVQLVGMVSDAGAWATITVNSLADSGKPGICTLRDAITAANTMTPTNGCIAGKGHDTIQFRVTGTIKLANTLPEVTDSQLTINGPAKPGITIDGGGKVQVMQVAAGVILNLNKLTITNGSNNIGAGGGIINFGILTVSNNTFSMSASIHSDGGGIANSGALTVSDSIFSGNAARGFGGSILNDGTLTVTNSAFSGGGPSIRAAVFSTQTPQR